MLLSYFTEEAYDTLQNAIEQNLEKYASGDEWLEEYFATQPQYMKASTLGLHLPGLSFEKRRLAVEEKTKEDIANIKIIYGNLKSLTPYQATNRYMWSCLAHTEYREYVHHRWIDDEGFEKLSDEKKIIRIKSRYFVGGGKKNVSGRSLNDNALSRLWWYGHVSYDEKNTSNPFHLTEVLASNTKFCTDFMQNICNWNPSVGKGVLRAISDFRQELGANEGISGYYRNYLKKYMNRYGAVSSLYFLSEDEVYSLALDYLHQVRKNKVLLEEDIETSEDDED